VCKILFQKLGILYAATDGLRISKIKVQGLFFFIRNGEFLQFSINFFNFVCMAIQQTRSARAPTFIIVNMPDFKTDTLSLIKEFSEVSDSYSVEDFIETVDDYQKLGSWTDEQACRAARRRISGKIADLIRADEKAKNYDSWNDLKKFLLERLGPIESTQEARFTFMSLTQKPNESVDEFALRLDQIAKKASLTSSVATEMSVLNKVNASDKLLVFINGLRTDIWNYVYSKSPTTYSDALALARHYETSLKQREKNFTTVANIDHSPAVPSTSTSELNQKMDELVGAMTLLATNQKILTEKLERQNKPEEETVFAMNSFPGYRRKERVKIEEVDDDAEDNGKQLAIVKKRPERRTGNFNWNDDPIRQFGFMFIQNLMRSQFPGNARRGTVRKCYNCGKKGHVMKNCRAEKSKKNPNKGNDEKYPKKDKSKKNNDCEDSGDEDLKNA